MDFRYRRHCRGIPVTLTSSQKTALWSLIGLAGSLAIAWYFSKRETAIRNNDSTTSPDNSASDGSGNMYTFNIPPLQLPELGVTIPPSIPVSGTGTGSGGCCTPCGGGSLAGTDALADAIANSVNYNKVAQNTTTSSAVNIPLAKPKPYQPLVIDRPDHPGIADPNPYLQQTDPVYAAAYAQAAQRWNEEHTQIPGPGYNKNVAKQYNNPPTGWMLQQIQQYLFLFGDNPNAGATAPAVIH